MKTVTIKDLQCEIAKLSREIKKRRGNVVHEAGIKIRILRKRLAYTQDEFAKMLDVSRPCIGSIESGRQLFSIPKLISICDILGITPDVLFGYKKMPKAVKNDK